MRECKKRSFNDAFARYLDIDQSKNLESNCQHPQAISRGFLEFRCFYDLLFYSDIRFCAILVLMQMQLKSTEETKNMVKHAGVLPVQGGVWLS